MMGTTHLFAAVTASSFVLGPETSIMAISALGGLMPDIDSPHSAVGRKLPIIPEVVNLFFGHRTITHSLLGVWGTGFLVNLINPVWTKAWLVGYGSHLLLDFLTASGIPLLWPWTKRLSLGFVSTG